MIAAILSLAWPGVGLTLVLLANARLKAHQRLREPMAKQQYDALVERMADLENAISKEMKEIRSEVNSVSIQKGIRNYEG